MISRGLKSSVLLNINHGSFAADLASFICDGLAIPQRERLFLRPFGSFCANKMTIATAYSSARESVPGPRYSGLLLACNS